MNEDAWRRKGKDMASLEHHLRSLARADGQDFGSLPDIAAYVSTIFAYLYAIIFTHQLTVMNFVVFTVINVAWLALFHRLTRRACSAREEVLSVASLFVLTCLALLTAHIGITFDWVLPCVMLGVVAMSYPMRLALLLGVGIWLSSILALITLDGGLTADAWAFNLTTTPAFAFIFCFATMTRQQQEARLRSQELLEKLEGAHTQLQAYAGQVEELAVTQERNRMAREIHDTLGHYLTILAVKLETAMKLEERQDAGLRAEILEARHIAAQCLAEVRQSVTALRPTAATIGAFADTLRRLATDFEAVSPGCAVTVDVESVAADFTPEMRMALYRCLQEALTNIRKHADATKVLVRLRVADGESELSVLDNGVGMQSGADGHAPGFGLLGMRERVALLGGTASAAPDPIHGWRVEVIVPLAPISVALPIAATAEARV
jgi:signal transduction histidine kinase